MVSALFDPRQPKSTADIMTLSLLSFYVFLVVTFPSKYGKWIILAIYALSRSMYNGGLGYLLYQQSFNKKLTKWAAKTKIFSKPGPNATMLRKQLYDVVRQELSSKMGIDYNFETVPIEYNTWLLFRRLVDFVLMSDFVSYMLFAGYCFNVPQMSMKMHVARWTVGVFLFLFNLWVKLDAHRVVKDYAWYWGDFFFLEDLELSFDGVFEFFPHPMYSVGYVGYYGISLIAASWPLFFVSLTAHACQFAFLYLVEEPHIAKTYPPVPKTTK
ncbi:phospholipid methyltransferase-domain-containing protein [Dipodascopsis uninucleata]